MGNPFKSRAAMVIAGAAVIGLVGAGGAVAKDMIDSSDIRNQSIKSVDIARNGVGSSEIRPDSVHKHQLDKNSVGWHGEFNQFTRNKISDVAKKHAGKDGKDGVSGVVIEDETFDSLPSDGRDTFGVYCPDGTNAIGGGSQANGGATVTADKPWWGTYGSGNESEDPNRAAGWNAVAELNGGKVTVWAICAELN